MPADPRLPNADDLKLTQVSPHVLQGWRRVFPVSVRRTDDGWQVEIYWRRLALTMVLLLGLGWVTLAGGAYLFLKYQRGFTEVRYADMLLIFLPSRLEAYETARGDFFIKNAKQELAQGKFREALFDLQIGVAKSPGNQEGRLQLAQFFIALHRPEKAQRLLLDGLPLPRNDKDEQDYLKALFSFLIQLQQQDPVAIGVARNLRAKDPSVSPRTQLIAFAEATALFYRGNYDQAEDLIQKYGLAGFRDARLLAIRIEWERGDHPGALAHLRELAGQLPQADGEIYHQTITYLRESGLEAEARRESYFQQLANPKIAYPRIDLLYADQKDGDLKSVREGVESILHDFAGDSQALVALADFAANSGDPALAQRIYEHCRDDPAKRLDWEDPALMVVEAHVVAKNYQAALDQTSILRVRNLDWAKRFEAVFNGLEAIAAFGLGDEAGGRLSLSKFISQPSVRAENFVAVSNRLLAIGQRTQARLVLAQAVKADRLNQSALTSLIKLDLELNNADALAPELRRLLTMRKPSTALLQSAYDKLGSDLFLFNPERTALLDHVRAALDTAKPRSAAL